MRMINFSGMKTAIVLGATGLTGGILVEKLLQDERYEKVKLFSRRTAGLKNDKVEEYIIDLFTLEENEQLFTADEVFYCIGSTKKKTPDEEIYREVDYGIPVVAAKLSQKNNISTFVVISALGANPESSFFYNRTKGEMERDVLKFGIPSTYILQPSLIAGERKEKRTFESLWKKLMIVGNHLLLGPLKKYRSIKPETIADAMLYIANYNYSKERIPSDEIKQIAAKKG